MTKRVKHARSISPAPMRPDIAALINKMQEQLASLDKKMDTLISQSAVKAQPFARIDPANPPLQPNRDNSFRERTMHKAICADCRKECEVPFKPTGDRPVYCKECFSKRKQGSQFKGRHDNFPKNIPAQARHADKQQGSDILKPAEKKKVEKKKPAHKRRKK